MNNYAGFGKRLWNGLLFHVSVAIEMEAGRRGHHGDNAAQPVVQASSYVSVLVTTRHLDMVAACVWGRAGMKGEDSRMCECCHFDKSEPC